MGDFPYILCCVTLNRHIFLSFFKALDVFLLLILKYNFRKTPFSLPLFTTHFAENIYNFEAVTSEKNSMILLNLFSKLFDVVIQ